MLTLWWAASFPTVVLLRKPDSPQLVNNEVFSPSLNADLTNMFLDLKDGAKIVSLKPFVPESFKMNEANVSPFRRPALYPPSLLVHSHAGDDEDSGVLTPVRLLCGHRATQPTHLPPRLGLMEGRVGYLLPAGD